MKLRTLAIALLALAPIAQAQPAPTTAPGTRPADGPTFTFTENPLIRDRYTADPAALVVKDRLYLYTGHDEAKPTDNRFVMRDWRCYSTDDMKTWRDEGSPFNVAAFKWARSDAWASQVIEKGGKFYWFATVNNRADRAFAIAVGVADSPTGPFVDAMGKPLITNDMTTDTKIAWDDLDPSVIIDDDGTPYLFWGNTKCRYVKLKPSMTELDGPITDIPLPEFTEAPWIHKANGRYYLSFAHKYPETLAYATADKITGPYTFQKIILDLVPDSRTSHQAIVLFKDQWYFFYHTAALSHHEYRRSVCVEKLAYTADGSIEPIKRTGLDADRVANFPPPATKPK